MIEALKPGFTKLFCEGRARTFPFRNFCSAVITCILAGPKFEEAIAYREADTNLENDSARFRQIPLDSARAEAECRRSNASSSGVLV
jgi:hypothetical protein